jgi:hypothetical protein
MPVKSPGKVLEKTTPSREKIPFPCNWFVSLKTDRNFSLTDELSKPYQTYAYHSLSDFGLDILVNSLEKVLKRS